MNLHYFEKINASVVFCKHKKNKSKIISHLQHISGNKHLYAGNIQVLIMKQFILKNAARLFTVLGCSTLVTACYGVPYEEFSSKTSGKVVDADTGEPIEGIQVRITAGLRSQGGENSVQGLVPVYISDDIYTDAEGAFQEYVYAHREPDGVLIECLDVDGKNNGSYDPETVVCSLEEAENAVVRMQNSAR